MFFSFLNRKSLLLMHIKVKELTNYIIIYDCIAVLFYYLLYLFSKYCGFCVASCVSDLLNPDTPATQWLSC